MHNNQIMWDTNDIYKTNFFSKHFQGKWRGFFNLKNASKNIFPFQELCVKFGKYFKTLTRTIKH